MIDKFPFAKKSKWWQTQGDAKTRHNFIQRQWNYRCVIFVGKQENAVNWEHIRIIHAFILLVAVALIHTEFPCACTHKNVNKYGSVRIQAMGEDKRGRNSTAAATAVATTASTNITTDYSRMHINTNKSP